MITIEKFIEEFNTANDKAKYVQSHIVTDYIDYAKKIAISEAIAAKSLYTPNDDFYPNSPIQYNLFINSLIELYMDIEIQDNRVEIFDAFEHYGVTDIMCSLLGDEYHRFQNVLKATIADKIQYESNLVQWLEGKINAFSILKDEFLTDEKVQNMLMQQLGK